MGVQDEIFQWVQSFEPWKQDLFLRACATRQLSDADTQEAVDLLLGRGAPTGPRLVSRHDMPGGTSADAPLTLACVHSVVNVNALARDQVLALSSDGINVVYGANGAGKTGYSRVVKHAGRTLHREDIVGNVVSGDPTPSSAVVRIAVGGSEADIALRMDGVPPVELSRICVFDARAGERYVTRENEIDYVPLALQSVQQFISALKAMDIELRRRLDAATPEPLDLSSYDDKTSVVVKLRGLSSGADMPELREMATLSPDEERERIRMRTELAALATSRATELKAAAEREARMVRALASALEEMARRISAVEVGKARADAAKLLDLNTAAKTAAAGLADAPLEGVGTGVWRMMWDAAVAFSAEVQEAALPPDQEPGHCPLCMQELDSAARRRLRDFRAFVADNINERRDRVAQMIEARRTGLPNIAGLRATHAAALDLIGAENKHLQHAISSWLEDADAVSRRIDVGELADLVGVNGFADRNLDAWLASRDARVRTYEGLLNPQAEEDLRRRAAELEARTTLQRNLEAVAAHAEALDRVAELRAVKAKLSTGGASTRLTEFSSSFVSTDLAAELNAQIAALAFEGLHVDLRIRTDRGRPLVGLKLKAPGKASLSAVLSEGEQRRLALAMFLAEMSVMHRESPIVLDDPVCSIDHDGRRHIARSLAKLAANGRQITVFTHELSFVREIERETKKRAVRLKVQQVVRRRRSLGHIEPELPWAGQDGRKRRGTLVPELEKAKALHDVGDPEYDKQAAFFCKGLREAFERIVEDDVLGGTIVRRDDAVHTTQLRDLIVEGPVLQLVSRGMDEASPWMHDRPLLDNSGAPTPSDLAEGMQVLDDLLSEIRRIRKEREGAKHRTRNHPQLVPTDAPAQGDGEHADLELVSDAPKPSAADS